MVAPTARPPQRTAVLVLTGQDRHRVDLDAGRTSHVLGGLQPNTDYVVMVAPLFGQLEGPTATVRQKTGRWWVWVMRTCCWPLALSPVPLPRDGVGTSTLGPTPRCSPPSCVRGPGTCRGGWPAAEWHRAAWPTGVPLAEAGAEQTLRTNILGPTSIQVLWTSARDARGYRLEWKRATGGLGAPGPLHRRPVLAAGGDLPLPTGPEPPRTVSLPSSANTYQLMGLQPGTEYRITLYTLYDGGEVATPVTTFQTGE